MAREIVRAPNAPPPQGPYSPGIKVANFLFVAGQGPIDPKTSKLNGTDIQTQTRQTLENVKAIVEGGGFTLQDVVKVSVFLSNSGDFQRMNEVYKDYFPQNPPVRTTVEVRFPLPGMLIEIDAIAYRG